MNRLFTMFVVCELVYVLSVRVLLYRFTGSSAHLELYWSAIRLVSIGVLLWLYRRLTSPRLSADVGITPGVFFAAGMFLAPILAGDMGIRGSDRFLFAATSILVGLREELAYRGILQNFLARRFGIVTGLVVSNLAFVGYHFGIQPFSVHFVLQLFLCGMILGVVYYRTGSIMLSAAFHAVYDAIDSFTPYMVPPMPGYVCTIVLVLTLVALVIATKRPKRGGDGEVSWRRCSDR